MAWHWLGSVLAEYRHGNCGDNLVNIFCRGSILKKKILSDRETQFKSDLMSEINRLLSIKVIYTSPYYVCCNRTVERFHAVLKSMLKKLCNEKPHGWDRYIPSGNPKRYARVFTFRTILWSTGSQTIINFAHS